MTLAGQTISVAEDFLIFKVLDNHRSEIVGGSSSNCLTIRAIIVSVLPKPMSSAKMPPRDQRKPIRLLIHHTLSFSILVCKIRQNLQDFVFHAT